MHPLGPLENSASFGFDSLLCLELQRRFKLNPFPNSLRYLSGLHLGDLVSVTGFDARQALAVKRGIKNLMTLV